MARFANKLAHTGEVGSEKRHGALRLANSTEAAAQSSTKLAVSPANVSAAIPRATDAEAQSQDPNSDKVLTVSNLAADDFMQWASATLAATTVKALRATPATLVEAPGAGKYIEFLGATLKLTYGSEVFTESADNLAIKYTDGSGVAVSDTIESTGFIDQSSDTYTRAVPVKDAIVAAAASENQALVLHNTGDGEIGGNASDDSILNVEIHYRVLDI
jgi:hypothetical protein